MLAHALRLRPSSRRPLWGCGVIYHWERCLSLVLLCAPPFLMGSPVQLCDRYLTWRNIELSAREQFAVYENVWGFLFVESEVMSSSCGKENGFSDLMLVRFFSLGKIVFFFYKGKVFSRLMLYNVIFC